MGEEGRAETLASLAIGWRICRYLAIVTRPFLPFSAQKLWNMLGIESDLADMKWDQAIDWSVPVVHPSSSFEPLFKRLDVDEIVKEEQSYVEISRRFKRFDTQCQGRKKRRRNV